MKLAAKLREQWPQVNVLFLSGYADEVARAERFDGRANFLQRPFIPQALAIKVRETIDGVSTHALG